MFVVEKWRYQKEWEEEKKKKKKMVVSTLVARSFSGPGKGRQKRAVYGITTSSPLPPPPSSANEKTNWDCIYR